MRAPNFYILPISEAGNGVRGTPIQNALVVQAGTAAELTEVNPDLQILDAGSAFWHSVENEAKINVGLPFDRFGRFLDEAAGDAFSFGPLAHSLSYERHFLLRSGSAEAYVVRLGRKNDKRKPAIKLKEARGERNGILMRSMKLEEWSPAAFDAVVEEFGAREGAPVEVTRLRPFYKRKARAVCIHRRHGLVFGVSIDRAKPVGLPAELSQIEVEYWSALLPKDAVPGPEVLPSEALISEIHVELCGLICRQLAREGAAFEPTCLTKSEWIRQVSEGAG
ncbi:MAG TPA: hypothetical protein VJ725_07725 [Thermoanaerobaculia bacterium]|nr:hypothetical protein [Thermoanaerobaculia bacterium]